MSTDREPAAIAYHLATEARVLRDRTTNPAEYRTVADVRDVAEGLHLTADLLPQAVRQLSAGLRLLEEQGALHAEDGADASETVSQALRALLNAEVGLALTRAALREAVAPLARLDEQPSERAETADAH